MAVSVVSFTATAADPCDLGKLVPGESYSFPVYTEVKAEYTPSATGPVKFLYTSNPLTMYTSSDYTDESIVEGQHSYVDGKQMVSYAELNGGQTYYLYSAMTMMAASFEILEGRTELEMINVTPSLKEGETFSVSSNYTIDVAFNVPVTVGNTLIIAGNETARVASTVSNTYIVCDVASTVMGMYHNGTIKGGDVMTLRLVNVTDASDSDNKYNDEGVVEIDFVMADKPGELVEIVNADQSNTDNPFMSYYANGDEAGSVSFVFDRPVSADKSLARITYGDTDNMDVGVYVEEISGKADGNSVMFDFTGKLRRPIDMLPESTTDTQPESLHILFGNIYTEDGQRVYTGRQSNPTGYSMSFKLHTLQYTISSDFTPGRGSKLEAGNNMEIWVMNGLYVHASGIRFDFTKNGVPASVVLPMSEVTVEQDPIAAEDMIFTFKIPELNADEDTTVTVSFADVECSDGLDHSNELTAEFGYATSGIENVDFSNEDSFAIYNAAGICVKSNASKEDLKSLPKGLYIVNGKKIVL